jgi:hypothetical protein
MAAILPFQGVPESPGHPELPIKNDRKTPLSSDVVLVVVLLKLLLM